MPHKAIDGDLHKKCGNAREYGLTDEPLQSGNNALRIEFGRERVGATIKNHGHYDRRGSKRRNRPLLASLDRCTGRLAALLCAFNATSLGVGFSCKKSLFEELSDEEPLSQRTYQCRMKIKPNRELANCSRSHICKGSGLPDSHTGARKKLRD